MSSKNEAMLALFKSGKTQQEIGDIYSVSRQRVQQCLSELGASRSDGGASMRPSHRVTRGPTAEEVDARYMKRWGCTKAQYEALPWKAVAAFRSQKGCASYRGIEWSMKLYEWYTAWINSGFWDLRGRGGGYVMARRGDVGPYSLDNIYFCTSSKNIKDSYVNRPASVRKKSGKSRCSQQAIDAGILLVTGGMSRVKAAKIAGVSRQTLGTAIKKRGLDAEHKA